MNRILVSAALLSTLGLAACGKYNHTKELNEFDKKAKPRVYGNVGGDPLQLAHPNVNRPDQATKSLELKAKLTDKSDVSPAKPSDYTKLDGKKG